MFGLNRYNYDRFSKEAMMKDVLLDRISGPKPGDRAPDFKARTLDGQKITLSDFEGDRNVVLVFGSGTCPFTAASIRGLNRLYDDYGEQLQFLFCYVREAHPGERLGAHQSAEDKEYAAGIFRKEEDVEIPIIVDDVKGTIHRKYGKLPNPAYLIDKSGRVAFRSLWTRAGALEDAIEELLERQEQRDADHAIVCGGEDRTMPTAKAMLHARRALDRGGQEAIRHFQEEMGLPGRLAVTTGRVMQPVAENLARSLLVAGLTAAVVVGGVVLGSYLRRRRFRSRSPYDIESQGMPRRTAYGDTGDYEAVGI